MRGLGLQAALASSAPMRGPPAAAAAAGPAAAPGARPGVAGEVTVGLLTAAGLCVWNGGWGGSREV
jgi:hypothetical protein